MDSYFPTTSDIIGIVLSEIMSIIADEIKDKKKTRKIENRLKNGIETILNSEKDNVFYNDLCAVMNNSHIIADYVSRCIEGKDGLDIRQRVADYARIKQYDHSREQYFYGVFLRIQNCIEEVLRESLNPSDKLLLHFIENNYSKSNTAINESKRSKKSSKLTNTEKHTPIKISSLEGHNIPDTSGMALIKRSIHSDDKTIVNQSPINNLSIIREKKHIIISGEAGSGKTYILYQLFEEASVSGIHLIYYSLPIISSNNTLEILVQGDVEIDMSTLILLDGYDELSEDRKNHFIEILSSISKRYSDLLIVICSRGNAIDKRLSSLEFKTCSIAPLKKEEISKYLDSININSSLFLKQAKEQGLSDIYTLPFYLRELVNMWLRKGELPSRSSLMRTIVHTRIQNDSNRYSKTQIRLQQDIVIQTRSLERIAHIMLCIQKQQLSESEINMIVGSNKNILEYYGLWVKSSEDVWCFSHNIFREYFAAISLSRLDFMCILSYITSPDAKSKIRPSWYNVLGFILSECYIENKNTFDCLLDWLIDHDLYALMFCEKDKVSDDVRSSAFIEILNCCKNENSFLDSKLIKDSHFSVFTNTAKTIEYIVQEFDSSITNIQKNNLLKCLSLYDYLYGYEQKISEILREILFNPTAEKSIKELALDIIYSNNQIYSTLKDDIFKLYNSENNPQMQDCILRIWHHFNVYEDYFELILHEYDKYVFEKNMDHYFFLWRISIMFSSIKHVRSAELLLEYFISHNEKINKIKNDNNAIPRCCSLGISAYKNGINSNIINLILRLIAFPYVLRNEDWISIRKLMLKTNSSDVFLDSIISESSGTTCAYILGKLLCTSFLDSICIQIQKGNIDLDIIEYIIQNPEVKLEYRKKLFQFYFAFTGKSLPSEMLITSIRKTQIIGYQKYIYALFDKKQYETLIRRITEILGVEAVIKEMRAITEDNSMAELKTKTELYNCYLDLTSLVDKFGEIRLSDCLHRIDDWDYYRLQCLTRLFESEGSKVSLNDSQYQEIKNYVLKGLQSIDYSKIYVEGHSIFHPMCLLGYLKALRVFAITCPKELALNLISIPTILYWDRAHPYDYPKCVLKSLSKPDISKIIVSMINNKNMNAFNAPTYINYCIKNNIKECKTSIIEYILESDCKFPTLQLGIKYVDKLFGKSTLLSEVIPFCSYKVVHEATTLFPSITNSKAVVNRLQRIYNDTKDPRCLTQSTHQKDLNDLDEYYAIAKKTMTIPKDWASYQSDLITHILNPNCIDTLIKLFFLSLDENFTDLSNPDLKHSCCSALLNISKHEYNLVVSKLEQKSTQENSQINTAINKLLQSIRSEHIYYSDTPWSFEEAINIVPK